MSKNSIEEKERQFEKISDDLNSISRNAEYLTKKSRKENPLYDLFKHPQRIEKCGGITYELDSKEDHRVHASSISVACCTKLNLSTDCVLEADIVIDKHDEDSKNRIKKLFKHPICAVTGIHEHNDERHIHILCNVDSEAVKRKAISLNKILI